MGDYAVRPFYVVRNRSDCYGTSVVPFTQLLKPLFGVADGIDEVSAPLFLLVRGNGASPYWLPGSASCTPGGGAGSIRTGGTSPCGCDQPEGLVGNGDGCGCGGKLSRLCSHGLVQPLKSNAAASAACLIRVVIWRHSDERPSSKPPYRWRSSRSRTPRLQA